MSKSDLTTFYIVRHGQTDWNAAGRLQGHTDIPLNHNGELQAKEIARKLKHQQFDVAFSSDLLRAKRTAEIIALEHNLIVQTTELLRERTFGEFEGKPYKVRAAYFELLNALEQEERYTHKMAPEIESDQEVTMRLLTFLRETAIANLGKNVLVVTHGGVMHVLLRHLGVCSYKNEVSIGNTAYIKLRSDGIDFFVDELEGIKKVTGENW